MRKNPRYLLVVALCAVETLAGNYPLGSLTCDDIGNYAEQVVKDMEAGKTQPDALRDLEQRNYKDPVEKKTLTDVLNLLYGGMGQSLMPDTANAVMKYDCETGRER